MFPFAAKVWWGALLKQKGNLPCFDCVFPPILNSAGELLSENFSWSLNITMDQFGNEVPGRHAWTGHEYDCGCSTSRSGNNCKQPCNVDCQQWTNSSTALKGGVGRSGSIWEIWTEPCHKLFSIWCMEFERPVDHEARILLERTQALKERQAKTLTSLFFVLALYPFFAMLTICLSKFYYKDKEVDYTQIIMLSLALMDVTSDFYMIASISSDESYSTIYAIGSASVISVTIFNCVAATFAIYTERKRKPEFNQWCIRFSKLLPVVYIFSAFKPNLFRLFGTKMFHSKTEAFCAPVYSKLNTFLRIIGIFQIVFEDLVQLALVIVLQQNDLNQWTILNVTTFLIGVLSLVTNSVVTCCKLQESYALKASVTKGAEQPSWLSKSKTSFKSFKSAIGISEL